MRWQQAKQGSPDVPLSGSFFLLLLGDPEALTSQMREIIYPVCSGSTRRSPTGQSFERKMPRRHPDHMPEPPQLAAFQCEGAAALLMASSTCLYLRVCPATLRRKLGHYWSLSKSHDHSKSQALPSDSASSSPRWSGTTPATYHSNCRSPQQHLSQPNINIKRTWS